jgi:hypothetical protein
VQKTTWKKNRGLAMSSTNEEKQANNLRIKKWIQKKRQTHQPIYAFVLKENAQKAKDYLKTLA